MLLRIGLGRGDRDVEIRVGQTTMGVGQKNQRRIYMQFMMLMIPAVYQGGKKVDPGFVPDSKKVEE